MTYDLVIVGAGVSGVFTALEYKNLHPNAKVLIIEKGSDIWKRECPMGRTHVCAKCKPCNITCGFSGAGAFSDGKLSLSPSVGGELPEYIGYEKVVELIKKVDDMYLSYGASKEVHGLGNADAIYKFKQKAISANLKLIDCPIRHLGTEESHKVYGAIQDDLILNKKVEIRFNTMVTDLIIEDTVIKGIKINDEIITSNYVVLAVGREGSSWLEELCKKYNISKSVGIIDVGVRVECRNEVMKEINDTLYESKLVYYSPTYDDKARVFCSNPGGFVSTEKYANGITTVNGHSYKNKKSDNTNFAILVSKQFTKPFNEPNAYGESIAKMVNMLGGGKVLVQRFGDLCRYRRTTDERLYRNNIIPTLTDAIAGDLSLAFPHRILETIKEMIFALDKVANGMASDETLLYGAEVKFYSNKLEVDQNFQTSIRNLYAIGDGAGVTRGLMQASCNGVYLANHLYCDDSDDSEQLKEARRLLGL